MTRIRCPLAIAAMKFGSEPAILDDDLRLDYDQLDRIAQSASDRFIQEGVGPGHRVG